MHKLVQGMMRFHDDVFPSQQDVFQKLIHGQKPEALFITCSDSRILPHLITQTEPGELFILRNAGNIVPPHGASTGGEAATIEFAVACLGVRHIIVCGHSHCGAMKALLKPETLAGLPATRDWLRHAEATRLLLHGQLEELNDDERLVCAVETNVLVQLDNLRTHPTVAASLARGQLTLHGCVYQIECGEVLIYTPEQDGFLPLSQLNTQLLPSRYCAMPSSGAWSAPSNATTDGFTEPPTPFPPSTQEK
ncbi:MAG: carbonic anhydrase [Gemmataceae bacterium]